MANIVDVTRYSKDRIPMWGNRKKYIVVHYLGVVGQNCAIETNGCGAHYYIYWDGTTYQACPDDAIVWQVGTAGGAYKQLHPHADNVNCIGIEMCVKCDGDQSNPRDPHWYFTEETQKACVELVKHLMQKYSIPAENVLMHGQVVNKWCPAPYLNGNKYKSSWSWEEFKAKLSQSKAKKEGGTSVTITLKQVKAGDTGTEVLVMQQFLFLKGYYKSDLDGSFGPASEKALRAFQKAAKLSVDGICGPASWHALFGL